MLSGRKSPILLLALVALAWLPAGADARRPQGVNVNQSQRDIDWKLVAKKSRFEFAYMRASEGLEGKDRYFQKNMRDAHRAGLRVGAFHRMYPQAGSRSGERDDALEEARVFVKSAGHLRKTDMIPILGVDPPFGGLSGERLIRWVQIWMNKVKRQLHVIPGIYTSQAIWASSLDDTKFFAKRGHRLWIASVNSAKPLLPAKDWNKKGWSIWQKQQGNVRGIDGVVNKNVVTYRGLGNLTIAKNRP